MTPWLKISALVPRENDMVRFTVQIEESDVSMNHSNGRVDRTKVHQEKVKQVCL